MDILTTDFSVNPQVPGSSPGRGANLLRVLHSVRPKDGIPQLYVLHPKITKKGL